MRSPAAASLRGAETPREPPRPSAVKVRAMARLQQHRANGLFNSNSPLAISKAKTPRASSGSGGTRPKRSEEEKAARKTKAANKRMHNLDIAEVCEKHGASTAAEVEALFAVQHHTKANREAEDLLNAAIKAEYKSMTARAHAHWAVAERKIYEAKEIFQQAMALKDKYHAERAGLEAEYQAKSDQMEKESEARWCKIFRELCDGQRKEHSKEQEEWKKEKETEENEIKKEKDALFKERTSLKVSTLLSRIETLEKRLQKQKKNKRNHQEQEDRRELQRTIEKENNSNKQQPDSDSKRRKVRR